MKEKQTSQQHTVMTRKQRKMLVKALRVHTNEFIPRDNNGHSRLSMVPMDRKRKVRRIHDDVRNATRMQQPINTFCFMDDYGEYVLLQRPLHGKGLFSEVINNTVSDNTFIMNMENVPKERKKAIIAVTRGEKKVIKYGNFKKKSSGRYHPDIGYIADDEAEPEAILNGEFKDADLKEWNSIIDNCVLEEAEETYRQLAIRTRFRRTYKNIIDSRGCVVKQPKTRFLVCAFNDNRPVDTTTHVPSAQSRRIATAFGLFRGWRAATIDIKTAFLLVHLSSEEPIYITLPQRLPQYIEDLGYKPHGVYRLRRALYG